jgi:hypothetical protein
MSGSAAIPVHIIHPDEEKRPKWFKKEMEESESNPRFEFAGVSTADMSPDIAMLVKDHTSGSESYSTMGPSQFGWIWQPSYGDFMNWHDVWNICRDAKPTKEGEEQAIRAINRFSEQGGKDIWGNSFDSNFESANTMLVKVLDKQVLYRQCTEFMGDRRYRNPLGPHRRSLDTGNPAPPRLSHILVCSC